MSTVIGHYENDFSAIKNMIIGRRIVKVICDRSGEAYSATLLLDSGVEIYIKGNEGCGGCENGNYFINYFAQDNEIVNAIVTNVSMDATDQSEYGHESFKLFVLTEDKTIKLAEISGTEGNGYYGRGFTVTASLIKD